MCSNILDTFLCVCVLNCVRLFEIPWTEAHQALLSMGFSKQEYWNKLPFPTPVDLPDPGIKPASPESPGVLLWQMDPTIVPPGKPTISIL